MTKEERFYNALQKVFIGAMIEGKGGFINLMKIKSNYYRKIEELLKNDVEKALEKYPEFRDELFDKLYSFFSRYFTENGSIYFNSTPFHNNIYERVYTDEKDVILFWKTQMLYYVKTDRIFRSLPVEFDGFKFYFDASKIENKKANEKRNLIYELKSENSNVKNEEEYIVFNVFYSEKGRVTKKDEILKELKKKNINIAEEQLERAFRTFEKQSEVDFFINKNAKAFLQEQFKLWSYQYFWDGAKKWSADRVNQIQTLQDIAFKIIDFISQFEDELVKIWNKPKFVKNSNYVITLDRIAEKNIEIVEKILNHKNIEEQINEWKTLGIIDDGFDKSKILENTLTGKQLSKEYKFLPIDTKYFKDLELEILSLFDDLDKSLDGWLIKSENYQALNTILPKFKEKVQTIYIDPPFNKEQDADYFYSVKYKDSSWATLLENRLRLARDLLKDTGSIFVRCDYNGNWIVRPLMNEIFGKENFRNEIIVKRGYVPKGAFTGKYPAGSDSIFFYSKTEKLFFTPAKMKIKEEDRKWISLDMPGELKDIEKSKRTFIGKTLYPPKGQHWGLSQEKIGEYEKLGWIRINFNRRYIDVKDNLVMGMPEYLKEPELQLNTLWIDIKSYETHNTFFPTENSEILLKRVIESTSNEGDLVMDFFLGSGTTTAVAHKLGRKWIGVEMGEHFYTVVLPRMKKVLAYDKSDISKEVKEYQGGGFSNITNLNSMKKHLQIANMKMVICLLCRVEVRIRNMFL